MNIFKLSSQLRNHLLSIFCLILLLAILFIPAGGTTSAQEDEPGGPVYIVQEGDTLWDIAQRFGIPWEDLARENEINDPGQLSAGDELVIPGFFGASGVLVTTQVPLGENLRSLSRRYNLPRETIIQLNHITTPAELYRGYNLVIPENNQDEQEIGRLAVAGGQTLLELAIANSMSPWEFVAGNELEGTWNVVPGDVMLVPDSDADNGPGSLPGEIASLQFTPDPLVQGETSVLWMTSSEELEVEGSLNGNQLSFFPYQASEYVALQGIHALAEPGFYPLTIEGELVTGVPIGFSQRIYVEAGDFAFASLQVPPETIDPEVTKPEDELWYELIKPVTTTRLWSGEFQSPVAPAPCGYTDFFGNRRSYNGSPYNFFHTGLDFCYNYNNDVNEIYAPADGIVVFAGPLIVRGNAVMIDHGYGIYSGYLHQEEILVEEGDLVETGQVIGIVGETGRVNGPHLHFEIWAGGVQVDPLDWLERSFP
ncbi:MAG: peptidoglycan DD-metalloendopeptidase family protein [Chloroflexota bacterium]|nr:MAG: peptidoglycan DD-metalloendopeptidase family protein [Chloroflexota bacterium]